MSPSRYIYPSVHRHRRAPLGYPERWRPSHDAVGRSATRVATASHPVTEFGWRTTSRRGPLTRSAIQMEFVFSDRDHCDVFAVANEREIKFNTFGSPRSSNPSTVATAIGDLDRRSATDSRIGELLGIGDSNEWVGNGATGNSALGTADRRSWRGVCLIAVSILQWGGIGIESAVAEVLLPRVSSRRIPDHRTQPASAALRRMGVSATASCLGQLLSYRQRCSGRASGVGGRCRKSIIRLDVLARRDPSRIGRCETWVRVGRRSSRVLSHRQDLVFYPYEIASISGVNRVKRRENRLRNGCVAPLDVLIHKQSTTNRFPSHRPT